MNQLIARLNALGGKYSFEIWMADYVKAFYNGFHVATFRILDAKTATNPLGIAASDLAKFLRENGVTVD